MKQPNHSGRYLMTLLPLILALTAVASAGGALSSIARRLANRSFPSVFQAWRGATNLHENPWVSAARNDVVWLAPTNNPTASGIKWLGPQGLSDRLDPSCIATMKRRVDRLRKINPNIVILCPILYYILPANDLPAKSPWWQRGPHGHRIIGWHEGHYYKINYGNPDYQRHIAAQCKAVMDTGLFDGIMLDSWHDNPARLSLIKTIRRTIGQKAFILANVNDLHSPLTAPQLNGIFMECWRTANVADWQRIMHTMAWSQKHLRSPGLVCLEFWYHHSRQDFNLMRAVTTLSLTQSNGCCLFSDPNYLPTPDHLHDWYPFWNKTLGKAVAPGRVKPDGSSIRRFQNGIAVFNPLGDQPIHLHFKYPMKSQATGKISRVFTVPPAGGDILLYVGHER